MKKYILLMLTVVSVTSLFSCKKFLDVKPEDRLLEDQAFANKKSINTVLNGLYINLAQNSLYGEDLTMSTLEILAQRYNSHSQNNSYKIAQYAYTEQPMLGKIESIWTSAYATILNINVFTENLTKYAGILDAETDSIYRGEAIGMRAMLHFDLLRLYGPIYNTPDSTNKYIPYYKKSKSTVNELLGANQVLDSVLADIKRAESLLKKDPIIANGRMPAVLSDGNDFMRNRNYRFNYYAVKALKARVYLYRGNKSAALTAAKEVIAGNNTIAGGMFPWTTSANALSEKINPDRVFSTEMILGIQNSQLYDRYLALFGPELTDAAILAPLQARLATVFESSDADYRYNLNWIVPSNGGKTYRTFYKYADVVDKTKAFRFSIPLIKISEMFFIAAECEPDVTQAFGYLNTARNAHGLLSLATTANLTTELQKEYQKEFFGEGQLFYFYKRKNITAIPNGAAASGNVTMNAAKYVLPLPLSETQYR